MTLPVWSVTLYIKLINLLNYVLLSVLRGVAEPMKTDICCNTVYVIFDVLNMAQYVVTFDH